MTKRVLVAPSILSADFSNMRGAVELAKEHGADWIHCDVMDGVFVENITFGFKMISDIKKHTDLPLDVHLMITQPHRYVERFIDAGADYLTVHYESQEGIADVIDTVKRRGAKCGLAINPNTDVNVYKPLIEKLDLLLLMSVFPGFGAQKLIETSYNRLKELKRMRDTYNGKAIIEIDGGINVDNCAALRESGVDVFVAGNAFFSAADKSGVVKRLKGE